MKIYFRLFLVVLTWVGAGNSASSQNILFNRVLPPEGKTFMHVSGMVQDRQGYMWLSTKKGLFRYDGYEMEVFKHNPADSNSLANDALEAIAVDSSGFIWIATFGGVGLDRLDPATGVFTHFRHNPKDSGSLSSDWITAVFVDREGTLWVGTGHGRGRGLNRYDANTGTFTHYRHNPTDHNSISDNEVRVIYEDKQGTLWVGTGSVYVDGPADGGLNRMDRKNGTFIRYLHDANNPHSLANNKVRAILEDSKGNFWVGTAGDGLHTMDRKNGTFRHYSYNPAYPEKLSRPPVHPLWGRWDHITFIIEDITGAIWIGTHEMGLSHYDPQTGRTTHYELQKDKVGGFPERKPWWAYSSKEGVIWISTWDESLYRINPLGRNLPYYRSEDRFFRSFIEEKNGTLWIATQNGLVVRRGPDGSIIKRYVHDPDDPTSLSDNRVVALMHDQLGNLWVGTERGLNLLDKKKGRFTRYRHDPGNSNSLSCDSIISLYADQKSNIWIGTYRGLNRLNSKTGTVTRYFFGPINTAGINSINSIVEDRFGQIWVGCLTRSGVQQLDPAKGRYKTFLKGFTGYSIYEDGAGILWVGGEDGMFQYNRKEGSFSRFVDSSATNDISYALSIIEDDQKNLWVSTLGGFLKINAPRNQTTFYGNNFGINKNSFIFCGYRGRRGKLYFGAYEGYYAFLPDKLTKGIKPPEILFSGFRLSSRLVQPGKDGPLTEPLTRAKKIRLRNKQNIFSIDFAAIDYTDPESNLHYFMLENYDEGWNQAGSERRASYFNVPPGRYTFRVKAANGYDVWAEKSVDIVIVPPWWASWWLRIPTTLLIVALLYGVIHWRAQRKFRRQLEHSEKEKQLADLRHRASELEMQALRSQMNPHFIFNSLNSINRFILQNDKAPASEYLTKFSRLVRLILQNSQAGLVPLESELEALKLYLELEALRFEQHFEYRIRVDENTDVEALKVPPLVIQPFAENAIWHGLMHKEEKGHLEIDIAQKEEALYCRITDDGIGRKKAAEQRDRAGNTHHSMGMRITADRIALLKEQELAHTSIQVNDLVLPDGSAGGTEVVLKLPIVYDQNHTN